MKKLFTILFLLFTLSTIAQNGVQGFMVNTIVTARSIAINFYGTVTTSDVNWNNYLSADIPPNNVLGSLKWLDDGTNSTYTITTTSSFFSANSVIDNGAAYCTSPTDGFPSDIHRYCWHGDNFVVTFSGLNNAKKYDIKVLGSTTGTPHGQTITSGTTSSWEAGNNCSAYGLLTDRIPSSGSIAVTLSWTTDEVYINGIIITEHN